MKIKKKLFFISFITLFVFILILFVSYILTPQPVNAMMVSLYGMNEYDNRIYMEESIPKKIKEELINDFEKSKTKILEYFDEIRVTPTIIFVQSPKALNRYAQNQTGQTYYMYWGNYIVIGPKGFNEDVIAHELMHSELRERFRNKNLVPVWFDEGLAMLVDDRYSIKNTYEMNFDVLESLKNRGAFYDSIRSRENYLIAKSEVRRWYGISGKTGLNNLINGLNKGIPFNKLYNEIENH
jgi:hypothetical protein